MSRSPPTTFMEALTLETERALRYRRPLTVGVLLAESPQADHLEQAFAALRRVDRAEANDDAIWLLLPEVSITAEIPARRLVECAHPARLGLARCPLDGHDADALVKAAQAAAEAAQVGEVRWAHGATTRVQIGDDVAIAADPESRRVFELTRDLAATDLPVLVTGETGTGKEIIAKALHRWSARATGPLISFNLAALPAPLAESELFGHVKGAFSGATADKMGLLEAADGGTLFLDEVAEAPIEVQAKLLRALETGTTRRIGAVTTRPFDARVVAATNAHIEQAIRAGQLRADLYYRLEVGRIALTPLRARPGDILPLAQHFLLMAKSRYAQPLQLTADACQALLDHAWPGNVRELRNVITRASATAKQSLLTARSLQLSGPVSTATPVDTPTSFRPIADEIRELEARRIREALAATRGVRKDAARLISMPQRTFVDRLKRYGINKEGDL